MLSELAINDAPAFAKLVDKAVKAIQRKENKDAKQAALAAEAAEEE
jgi:hypothetical protein